MWRESAMANSISPGGNGEPVDDREIGLVDHALGEGLR